MLFYEKKRVFAICQIFSTSTTRHLQRRGFHREKECCCCVLKIFSHNEIIFSLSVNNYWIFFRGWIIVGKSSIFFSTPSRLVWLYYTPLLCTFILSVSLLLCKYHHTLSLGSEYVPSFSSFLNTHTWKKFSRRKIVFSSFFHFLLCTCYYQKNISRDTQSSMGKKHEWERVFFARIIRYLFLIVILAKICFS